nr:MAG TPA: helix-turn-helix domain protein [Caudoviricetes sp.]
MEKINERIKQIRKTLNLSQAAFGKKIDVSSSAIGCWDIGIRQPKPIHISAICNIFNINEEWLLHGTGEMLKKDIDNNPALTQIAKEYNLTSTQKKFMKAFLCLTNEQKDTIIETMKIMVDATFEKKQHIIYETSDENLSSSERRALINQELDDEEKVQEMEKKEIL